MVMLRCLFIVFLFSNVYSKECYWNSKNPYSYFATKTAYDDVRGDIRDEPALEGCTPTSLWFMVRHGTRLPTPGSVARLKQAASFKEEIIRNHHNGQGEMCAQDIADLTTWTWNNTLEGTPGNITAAGYQELLQLGQRVREKYSSLLGGLDSFQFRSTPILRTRESAKAFVEALKGSNLTVEEPMEKDYVTFGLKECDKFIRDFRNQSAINKAISKFHQTAEYQQVLSNIRMRTGLPELSPDNVTSLYELCQYSRTFSAGRRHAWCSVFHDEDLPVMEYIADLTDYYNFGYASSTATTIGAVTLRNLYENLGAAVNGSHRVTGYFSHDFTIGMMYTTLGLFRDYPEISDFRMDRERKWRTSFMTPFACNLIVVLNKCSASDANTYKVQLFINEIMMPLCGKPTCDWTEFKEKLQPFAKSDLEFCKIEEVTEKDVTVSDGTVAENVTSTNVEVTTDSAEAARIGINSNKAEATSTNTEATKISIDNGTAAEDNNSNLEATKPSVEVARTGIEATKTNVDSASIMAEFNYNIQTACTNTDATKTSIRSANTGTDITRSSAEANSNNTEVTSNSK